MKRRVLLIAGGVLAAVTASGAQAQYYGTSPQAAPLYPYVVQGQQPYAVEVAPGTYVIQRPGEPRAQRAAREDRAEHVRKRVSRNDPVLIEELRQRHGKRDARPDQVIHTKKIVHDKPVVIERTRVVDDPPKVIVRKRYVDDTTASIPKRGPAKVAAEREPLKPDALKAEDGKKRVIEADAEVTIIGPDRMSIRLFRKRRGAEAKASAE